MTQTDISTLDARPDVTRAVTRGARRFLNRLGLEAILELTLKTGRRVDIAGLDKKGNIVFVEVKSSKEDFDVDSKWEEYLPYCDKFYFAVSQDFPIEILPPETGLIIADSYGGEIIRPAKEGNLNASRRKSVHILFARVAARSLSKLQDPEFSQSDL
ncbi:MAG: MmcB family DNA repair protein [Alphaproteobacteria bacterium]|nr:MmcB family DNA repair protein [Alphaproteobacteria bacterium]